MKRGFWERVLLGTLIIGILLMAYTITDVMRSAFGDEVPMIPQTPKVAKPKQPAKITRGTMSSFEAPTPDGGWIRIRTYEQNGRTVTTGVVNNRYLRVETKEQK